MAKLKKPKKKVVKKVVKKTLAKVIEMKKRTAEPIEDVAVGQ